MSSISKANSFALLPKGENEHTAKVFSIVKKTARRKDKPHT